MTRTQLLFVALAGVGIAYVVASGMGLFAFGLAALFT